MAQTDTSTQTTKFKPSCFEISIHGVIKAIEQIRSDRGDFYANTIIIPAEDLLSKPKNIIVYSQRPMGDEESPVEAIVTVKPQNRLSNGKWYFSCSLWKKQPTN